VLFLGEYSLAAGVGQRDDPEDRINSQLANLIMELAQYKPLGPQDLLGRRVSFYAMPFCHLVAVAASKWFIET
jgi:hypothetical protein